jgi:hypothetical protein
MNLSFVLFIVSQDRSLDLITAPFLFFVFSHGGKEPNPFDDEGEEWDEGDAGKVYTVYRILIWPVGYRIAGRISLAVYLD